MYVMLQTGQCGILLLVCQPGRGGSGEEFQGCGVLRHKESPGSSQYLSNMYERSKSSKSSPGIRSDSIKAGRHVPLDPTPAYPIYDETPCLLVKSRYPMSQTRVEQSIKIGSNTIWTSHRRGRIRPTLHEVCRLPKSSWTCKSFCKAGCSQTFSSAYEPPLDRSESLPAKD
jgi:hypothetical protein